MVGWTGWWWGGLAGRGDVLAGGVDWLAGRVGPDETGDQVNTLHTLLYSRWHLLT